VALPRENRTEKTDAVEEAIKNMSPQEFAALPGLEREDFEAFGMLIQHFCFIDLNLRRALEVFASSKMLPKKLPKSAAKGYQYLSDSDLTEVFIKIVNGMDAMVEDTRMALFVLEGISKARGNRNLVSHHAGKRFPNEDVYVFLGKNERDARKVLSHGLVDDRALTTVVGRSEFLQMTKSVEQAQLWLAKKIPEWKQRYP
jgi:hypothetical protein